MIRRYQEKDCEQIEQIFYHTIHTVNVRDYNADQIAAWAPQIPEPNSWNETLLKNFTIVAEKDGIIIGFGDIEYNGYVNRLFVHKEYQGKGVATAIMNELERFAFENDIKKVYTAASITARPFFEKRGYVVIKQNSIERRGVFLTNFSMEKLL